MMRKERKALLGYYNYTVIVTYLGALAGFAGCASVMEEKFFEAVICLMVAGICDMFDGAIAATKVRDRSEKRFGIQIDSMSDFICFGVLPAVWVYAVSGLSAFAFLPCCLYLLCVLIRLSYFNVAEEERQEHENGKREYYLGLPVTTVALLLPACYVMQRSWMPDTGLIYILLLLAAGAAFLLPIRVRKPYLAGKVGILLMGVMEFMLLLSRGGMRI